MQNQSEQKDEDKAPNKEDEDAARRTGRLCGQAAATAASLESLLRRDEKVNVELGLVAAEARVREGKSLPETPLPFHRAMPSMTHMALVELERVGILKFVISQNIDGLHLRSGIPREKLSELHGNAFMELCPSCGVEYFRDFEVETIGLKETPRSCSSYDCGARLKDTVVDWEVLISCVDWLHYC
ncbi:hypothetical protein HYC85_011569 [Camellia sinensis]|uniref:protein acetyllysine N-acetyltransferase n=1 Tax=Camellia sinensis TaxID=4442 RepID=A0A7J7HCP1_CAMSI|nr:hypothetical protein HYC85_011569 [Camellia sinensis]